MLLVQGQPRFILGLYENPRWRFRVPEPQDDIGLRLHLKPYQQPHPPIWIPSQGSGETFPRQLEVWRGNHEWNIRERFTQRDTG